MTVALEELPDGTASRAAADAVIGRGHDVVATGLASARAPTRKRSCSRSLERFDAALVLDADASRSRRPVLRRWRGTPDRPVVITPHPGEMARLVGLTASDVQRQRISVARDFAAGHHVYVILKGYRTHVATHGRRRLHQSPPATRPRILSRSVILGSL